MKRPPLPLLASIFTGIAAFTHAAEVTLLDDRAPAQALVPSVANGGSALVPADWTTVAAPPNAASWLSGSTGIGYDSNPDYAPHIGLDVDAEMNGTNTSAFVRIPFTVPPAVRAQTLGLFLEMKFDDGFVAYLNGAEIAGANAPAALAWNSAASANNSDASAVVFARFDVTASLGSLVAGDNMLAVHGLNDGLGSSDFLISARLVSSDVPPKIWPDLQIAPLVGGLERPTGIAHAGDGSGRLFVLTRLGQIRVVLNGALLPQPFLDISDRVDSSLNLGNEKGLLGIAFPPDFAENGWFYLNYISSAAERSGDTVLSRFHVSAGNANIADPASEEILLIVDQPYSNHNGGQLNFGTDGFLYCGFGDGGSAGDPEDRAQNPATLLGKMIRIDVESAPAPGKNYAIPQDNPFVGSAGVLDEIWTLGLRNPWRWSFDRKTGDMWIADVGQGAWEEVNFTPASSTGGENYGWDFNEGLYPTAYGFGTPPSSTVPPVFEYGRSLGTSVTGGYVYRGSRFPRMHGVYFVADYGSGRFWGVQPDTGGTWASSELTDTAYRVSCFGEDEAGELYFADLQGGVLYTLTDTRDSGYLTISDSTFDGQIASLTFGAEIGAEFQMQGSADLSDWTDLGTPLTAETLTETLAATLPPPFPSSLYLRIARID